MTTVELSPEKVCDHTGKHETISDCCSRTLTGWFAETGTCPKCKCHTIPVTICAECGEDVDHG